MMTYKEALESLNLKFSSGNNIPVERSIILKEEWELILSELNRLKEYEWMYDDLSK